MSQLHNDDAEGAAAATKRRVMKKTAVALTLGGLAGFAGSMALLHFLDTRALPEVGASVQIAALVALVYVLTALSVAVGVASPKAGARFLNVEDAEELHEQRGILLYSGLGMGAAGIALAVVALGGVTGAVDPAMALAVYLVLSVLAVWLSLRGWKLQDELMRAAGNEAAALSYYLMLGVGGTWAVLAHLGFVAAPAPIDWLSLFWAMGLLAAFIAAGKRGMLTPR